MPPRDDNRLLRVQASITGRDLRLLGWLHDHGVLTTAQIAHALFASLDVCQRRLQQLHRLQLVARFRPQRWEGGSYPYHYLLDQLGVEVVAAQRGDPLPRRDHARQRRHHLTSRANLPHLLGINQFFVDLAGHERIHAGTRLRQWRSAAAFHHVGAFFREGDDPQLMVTPMPRPDGQGQWTDDGHDTTFLLEYDLATEKLAILADKISRYAVLASLTVRPMPVLFHLPTVRRERNLHQLISTRLRGQAIVATTAADLLHETGMSVAQEVWWLHDHQGPRLRLSNLTRPDRQADKR